MSIGIVFVMADKIIFLGTGGDSYVVSKGIRASGGIILKLEGMQFHIDPGPSSILLSNMSGINVRETTAVFVSHNHTNHANDLNAMIEAITLSGLDKKSVLITNNEVFYGSEEKGILPSIKPYNRDAIEKYIVVHEGQKIGIGNVDVVVTSARHTAETVGFKFITSNYCIGYLSDTEFFSDLLKEFEKTNVLILNVLNPEGIVTKGQLNVDDAVKIISAIKPELSIITHFGTKLVDKDVLQVARDIQMKTGCQVIAAEDGLSIVPSNYASFYQKRLNNY
ncbi:MAG: hypothetical protein GWP09_00570 [Nitrospiraceae bacterium]|nr:hypothetical protein [Nitrospiraceae bacterium]